MHYKNGREAKNGDKVVLISGYGNSIIGILYDAVAGNEYCNGRIAPISPSDSCPNLQECLHLEDVLGALPANVPDRSAPGVETKTYADGTVATGTAPLPAKSPTEQEV